MARYKSQRTVADIFNISQSTVSYCKAMSKLLDSLPTSIARNEPPASPGVQRPKNVKLDNQTLEASATKVPRSHQLINRLSQEHRWDTNSRFLERLALEHGVVIAVGTLRRARRILGMRRCVAVTKPYLGDTHKANRLAYAQQCAVNQLEWRKVIFTDEVALYVDQLYQAHVTRPRGSNRLDEKYIQFTFRQVLSAAAS